MHISKIKIQNFKRFKNSFTLELNKGTNILVGNNEAGKSTILEAIHLGLTGFLNGRPLKSELSQYLFNREIENEYIASLANNTPVSPPFILIELFITSDEDSPALAKLEGNGNSERVDDRGVSFRIEFDETYQPEYAELLRAGNIKSLPIEYYKVSWKSFDRDSLTAKSIPLKSALIDSSGTRVQNGSDLYVSRIIRENLDDKERVEISQAHRQMREAFMTAPSVQAINTKINAGAAISDKEVKISVDMATQNAWEMSLMTYLDNIPFHYIGKGEQSIIKTSLALSHRKAQEASLLLIEEPENHLSHTRLSELINRILSANNEKQIIVSTHSSFVANKLGLNSLLFLNDSKCTRLNELTPGTKDFFLKLAGYDTLRLILCKKAILVEGDSDELIVQKAYLRSNGKLPIVDGVDVISVGTSFLRFLEISEKINKTVAVVTDNDGNIEALNNKYASYIGGNKKTHIDICFDETIDAGALQDFNYNTLEPKLLKANDRALLNRIFETNYATDDEMCSFMVAHKTACALKIFDTTENVNFPDYITNAI
ncbi:MAG: ATP-dependent endonuclease [Bdellovibrionales bacterium GWA2_49_15]|nr:MAG: ATP-dependent endonuclease [Bdellovibrionales bacterium GWA2_49_15]HAZ13258.1 ATP-dependent endonuclease [Bdellovibrionales bacterium]